MSEQTQGIKEVVSVSAVAETKEEPKVNSSLYRTMDASQIAMVETDVPQFKSVLTLSGFMNKDGSDVTIDLEHVALKDGEYTNPKWPSIDGAQRCMYPVSYLEAFFKLVKKLPKNIRPSHVALELKKDAPIVLEFMGVEKPDGNNGVLRFVLAPRIESD